MRTTRLRTYAELDVRIKQTLEQLVRRIHMSLNHVIQCVVGLAQQSILEIAVKEGCQHILTGFNLRGDHPL